MITTIEFANALRQVAGDGSIDEDWAWPAIVMFARVAAWVALVVRQASAARQARSESARGESSWTKSAWFASAWSLCAGGLVLASGFG